MEYLAKRETKRNKNFKKLGIFATAATMCMAILVILTATASAQVGSYELVEIGNMPGVGNVNAIVVVGNYAFITTWDQGFRIINVSDKENPFIVDTVNAPWSTNITSDFCIQGDYAYVLDYGVYPGGPEGGLFVVNISDPLIPSIVGSLQLPSGPTEYTMLAHISVNGDYAYVSNWGYGLGILDISDPANPTPAANGGTDPFWYSPFDPWNYDTPATGVFSTGDLTYVTAWDCLSWEDPGGGDAGGVWVFDTSDPTLSWQMWDDYGSWSDNRTARDAIATTGLSFDIEIYNGYAYVSEQDDGGAYPSQDGDGGLTIIPVAQVGPPADFGWFGSPIYIKVPGQIQDVRGVYFLDDLAFIVDDSYGLSILDVSDPSTIDPSDPPILAYISTYGNARDVYSVLSSSYDIYVADSGGGMSIYYFGLLAPAYFRVTGNASMTSGGSNELTITAYDVSDNVATGYTGSQSLTFSGPSNAPDATVPTVEGSDMGTATAVNFTNGVSDAGAATLIAYLAETTEVDVTDGTTDSFADPTYDLDLTVNPGAASNIGFGQQPSNTLAGVIITPAVTVEVRDQWNNVRTSDNTTSVEIAINNNPGGGALSGTTPQTASSGIATFNDLSIDGAGGGYTLDATSSGLTTATSSAFNITAGTASRVVIEDAADGTGAEVNTRAIASGQSFTVYAISRDASDNFVENVAVSWSLIDLTGGVVSGDLVAAGDNRSAVFTGNSAGTARINALHGTLGNDATGITTVSAGTGTRVIIEDAADGTGAEVDTRAIASGQSFTVYAISRDASDNFVENVAVSWSLIDLTGGVVSGDLVAAGDNRSTVFAGHVIGTARMNAQHGTLGSDATGIITVTAGPRARVIIEDAANGTGAEVDTRTIASGQSFTVYAISRDASDNFVGNVAVGWSLINKTEGVVDSDLIASGDNRNAVFTGHAGGTVSLNAHHATLGDDTTGIITVTNQPLVALFEFNPKTGFLPCEISFDASASYDPDGNIISYEWDFGDGSIGSGVKTSHTYTSMGEFLVVLKVTDNNGLTDTATARVLAKTIFPPLNVNLHRAVNRSLFKKEAFHTITWSSNPANVGLTIINYRIYRKEAGEGDRSYQLIGNASGSTFEYVDGNLDVTKNFVYVITSVESSGHQCEYSFSVGN